MRLLRVWCVAGSVLLSAALCLPASADEGGPPKKEGKKTHKKKGKKDGDEGGPGKKG